MRRIAFSADWAGRGRAANDVAEMLRFGSGDAAEIHPLQSGGASIGAWPMDDDALAVGQPAELTAAVAGRLDNIAVLRSELGLKEMAGSAAVVAAAYQRWQDDCVLHFRGDVAFVVWDGRARRLLAARDPFGVQPLHYASSSECLWVASGVDQLVTAGVVSCAPDDHMVVGFLTRNFGSLERSYFRDARRLPPGHALVASTDGVRIFEYRAPPSAELTFRTTEDCHAEFRDRFRTAVQRRLSSPRPVIIQLSGGIDSTSIVCAADRLTRAELTPKIIAAAALHPGLACDEEQHIDAVRMHIQIPVITWDGTRALETELRDPEFTGPGRRIRMTGGADGFVAIARDFGADVVVDGTGGDQLGEPLGIPLDELAHGQWRAAAQHLCPSGTSWKMATRNLLWAALALSPPWLQRARYRSRQRKPRPAWLTGSVRALAFPRPQVSSKQRFISHGQRLRWEALTLGNLAVSVDAKQRQAALSGLEVRFPYLDWDLVSFVLAIPFQHWPSPTWLARLQREALRDELPPATYRRRSKAEFTPALVNRVRAQLEVIGDLLEGTTWASGRYVVQSEARRLLSSFRVSQTPDFTLTYSIWAIATVEAWLRMIMRYYAPTWEAR